MTGSRLYLLDTNTPSYIISGRSPLARARMDAVLPLAPVLISTVTEAEIRFGLERRPGATRLKAAVEKFLEVVQIRSWDSAAAHAYGRLRARLESAGTPLALADLMIAAHALAVDAILITHDKAFRNAAPYITIEDRATDLP